MENSMNKMIKRIREIRKQRDSSNGDLQSHYSNILRSLKIVFDKLYGEDLKDRLFDVYDEHCPDDEIQDVLDYICNDASQTSGVVVDAYDFPGVSSEITIKISPLRIELTGLRGDFIEVMWTAAA